MLNGGREILKTADLREPLAALTMPHLRIYGEYILTGLVPRQAVPPLRGLTSGRTAPQVIIKPKAACPALSLHPDGNFCSSGSAALESTLD